MNEIHNRIKELKSINSELDRLCIFSNYEREWIDERLSDKYGSIDRYD